MLNTQWRDGPLPASSGTLWLLLGRPEREVVAAYTVLVSGQLPLFRDGYVTNKWLEELRAKAIKRGEARKAAIDKRWAQSNRYKDTGGVVVDRATREVVDLDAVRRAVANDVVTTVVRALSPAAKD
jgi:hypothetical protein